MGRDALGFPGGDGDVAEGILPEARDEADRASGPRCGDGLVRALAARTHLEAGTHEGFAHDRLAAGAEGEIGDEDAENGDALLHDDQAFGGITPFLRMKQPKNRVSPVTMTA